MMSYHSSWIQGVSLTCCAHKANDDSVWRIYGHHYCSPKNRVCSFVIAIRFVNFWNFWLFVLFIYSWTGSPRGGCSVNTDSVKVPIFSPIFVDNFTDFSPISLPYFPFFCKLYNLTTFTKSVSPLVPRLLL